LSAYRDKIYIIGSLSQADKIESTAKYYIGTGRYDVRYVKPEPEKNLMTLIEKCFKNILWSDRVYVVPKSDGTFGDGVSYEIAFAKMIGKIVEVFCTEKKSKRGSIFKKGEV